jgi:hypothetical protein
MAERLHPSNNKGSIAQKIWEFFSFSSINVTVNTSFLQ